MSALLSLTSPLVSSSEMLYQALQTGYVYLKYMAKVQVVIVFLHNLSKYLDLSLSQMHSVLFIKIIFYI